MRTTLVISTYERLDALRAVLDTVARQRVLPSEVIIADDGSGPPTADVARIFAQRCGVPLTHVRQEHRGFRLTRLRNLAIRAASGEYLIFIDGDMLLHPEFVADHVLLARKNNFTQGVRIPLNALVTADWLTGASAVAKPPDTRSAGMRRLYGWHSPPIAARLRRAANHVIAIKGCNQAYWRQDLIDVNGFNEAIEGWGPEDKELAARLQHAGVKRQSLLFGGIAWHLHHQRAARDRRTANEQLLQATLANGVTRCEHGLDSQSPDNPVS